MTPAALLELFNDLTGHGATDAIKDEKKYTWLSRAQDEVISEVATVKPSILYPSLATSALPEMVTTDQNVFTFGTSGGTPIEPFGSAQIYKTVTAVPDRPLIPSYDYIDEGDHIRLPRNRKYSGPLYYRAIVMPPPITALVAPALVPSAANELTGIRAAMNFAESGNVRNATLADRMAVRWAKRFPHWCLLWKRQFSSGGALLNWSLRDIVTPLP
jgi:hypothetical protein